MSNSSLVNYTRISPNSTNPRNHKIDTITIHHVAGVATVEGLGSVFANANRQASSNYGIGADGRIGLYVDEANRSWCSSNSANDNRAITIEVSNSEKGGNWPVSDKVLAKLIDLCVDICQRNGIEKLNYTGDKTGNLTMHKWFAATSCPGPYLSSKFPYIAEEVNKRLKAAAAPEEEKKEESGVMYCVQVGAYDNADNAAAMVAKLKAAGFNAIIKTTQEEKQSDPIAKPAAKIEVGSIVRLNAGAKYYDGKKPASFVYNRNHKVKSISGNRVVITYNGITVGAVKMEDLTLQ